MGTENFIQSQVSSPDGVKFKPETYAQVMDTISNADYSKFGQLQADDICIPLNKAFGTKMSLIIKCYTAVRLKTVLSSLGPTICIENVNKNCIDDICESSRSHIVQVHNYLI